MAPLHDLIAWLLLPWSGATDHGIDPLVAWHGRLMVLAWGVAVPVAVMLARFYKVTPRQDWPRELDNKRWWHGHRALNYAAIALSCLGAWLAWSGERYHGPLRTWHALFGWTVVALGLLQVLGGHLRGSKGGPTDPRLGIDGRVLDLHGDHYDMTPRRLLFERIHKTLGYGALLVSALTVVLGLSVADAPRWMWIGLAAWWLALVAAAWRLQAKGRCIDTYQAIWGPDPRHPGAAIGPVGWGIRRVDTDGPLFDRT